MKPAEKCVQRGPGNSAKPLRRKAFMAFTTVAAVLFAAASGCGSPHKARPEQSEDALAASPLTGVYQLAEALNARNGCDEKTLASDPTVPSDKFFRLAPGDFFTQHIPLAYYACASANDCSTAFDLAKMFTHAESGVFTAEPVKSAASASGQKCFLSVTQATAQQLHDGRAEIRTTTSTATVDRPDALAGCSGEGSVEKIYSAGKAGLACTALRVLRGAKVLGG